MEIFEFGECSGGAGSSIKSCERRKNRVGGP